MTIEICEVGKIIGAWLSLVERLNGVQEVPSSNLGAPTIVSENLAWQSAFSNQQSAL